MADQKISELTAASTLDGTEVLPVVQSSTTKKATVDQVRDSVLSDVLAFLGMSTSVVDTAPRWAASSNVLAVTGTLYLTYFTPLVTVTASQVSMQTAAISSPSGITLAKIGLYTAAANGDVTLVARTASDTTLFDTGSAVETLSFDTAGGYPATYELVAGTRYAVGVLQVGTTAGRMAGTGATQTGGALLTPVAAAAKTGQTDIAGNVSSVGAPTLAHPWARFS